MSGTLTADSAADAWSVWTGTQYTNVERLVAGKWTRVPVPAKLTGYVRSAVAFGGDSASDFWLFDSYRANHALRFAGGKWTLQQIPAWVLPQRSGGAARAPSPPSVFGPDNVWVFGLDAGAYAAHYNGRDLGEGAAAGRSRRGQRGQPGRHLGPAREHRLVRERQDVDRDQDPEGGREPARGLRQPDRHRRDSAWVWRTILAPGPRTEADVLHWNGTSWRRVAGTPADNVDSVAPDGSGGLWATGVDLNPGGFNLFYHLTGGRWSEVNPPAGHVGPGAGAPDLDPRHPLAVGHRQRPYQ